jgi:hypothetical protein
MSFLAFPEIQLNPYMLGVGGIGGKGDNGGIAGREMLYDIICEMVLSPSLHVCDCKIR